MTHSMTDCGIPSIGSIPWGCHFCHFYSKKDDLVHALVPYFKAGLAGNERCIWVTSDPNGSDEAKEELQRLLPELEMFLEKKQMVICGYDEAYRSPVSGADRLMREEQWALDAGYAGLRVTGNSSFLKREQWPAFLEYEREVNRIIRSRNVVALCSYNIRNCTASDVFEVVRTHHFTVDRIGDSWEVIETEQRPFRE
jgi:hypothetical protein